MDEQQLLGLSQINTAWSLVIEAYRGAPDAVSAARQRLLQRYSGAIYRYLLGILRDASVADDLTRQFAARFLQGDLPNADLRRGRFRDAVKTALLELYNDYYQQQQQQKQPQPLPTEHLKAPAWSGAFVDLDQQFLESWRQELLNRAWEQLARFEEQTGRPLYLALVLRDQQPKLRSAELAVQLSTRLGKSFTATEVRQLRRDASEKLADFLLEEVLLSMEQPTLQELHEELLDLRLLDYCRTALDRYRQRLSAAKT